MEAPFPESKPRVKKGATIRAEKELLELELQAIEEEKVESHMPTLL